MGFPLDLVAILPYEIIAAPIPDGDVRRAVSLYLRLIHVARVVRIQEFFHKEEKKLNQKLVTLYCYCYIIDYCYNNSNK